MSCMIVLLVCTAEHIAAIFFARNGLNRNTANMLICFLYEKTRLNCQHSKEFFFLYANSRSITPQVGYADEDDKTTTVATAETGSSSKPEGTTTAAENITSDGMELLYKGNSFFMMPMYISKLQSHGVIWILL